MSLCEVSQFNNEAHRGKQRGEEEGEKREGEGREEEKKMLRL